MSVGTPFLHDPHLEHKDSCLDLMPNRQRIAWACQHILAAYTCEEPVYVRDTAAARVVNKLAFSMRSVKWLCVLGLVALSIFERPCWCIAMGQDSETGEYPCDTTLYPGWEHQYMRLWDAFSWEGACLAILILLEAGHTFASGRSYFSPPRNRLKWPLFAAAVADMAVAMATPATLPRLGPFLRIAIFANESSDIRREVLVFARIIPGLFSVLLLTVLNLAFFAFFGLVLFHAVPGAAHYFGTFGNAFWQLWVLQTTSNYPDIMLAPFAISRFAFIFFFVFICLATFFLMNLFTAAAYLQYQHCEETHAADALAMTERHLRRAFELLDTDNSGYLSRGEMLAVVGELRKAHLLPDIVQAGDAVALLFAALDAENNNVIMRHEFMELCTVLKVQWEEEGRATYLERRWPALYRSATFAAVRRAVLSDAFQWGCDLTVLLMCIATVWQTLDQLHSGSGPDPTEVDGRIDSFWDVVQLFFTVFFVFEVFLKVVVHGWASYWRDSINRLEFVTAVGCVVMSAAVYIPNNFDDAAWIRYATFLRLLRLFRLVRILQLPSMLRFLYVIVSVEHIRVFYETFLALLPAATRLLKVMFCIVYCYAALGVTLFGGLVTKDESSHRYRTIMRHDYGQSGYWLINMNDMPSGMVLMFQLLVVNNWMVFAEVYGSLAGTPSWIFFNTFYIIGVIAGLNVLVSFVLDAFIGEMEADANAAKEAAAESERAAADAANGRDGGGDRSNSGRTTPHMLRHASSHRTFAVVDGSEMTGNSAVQGKWRAKIKGYESSSQKAALLLKLLKRMPGASHVVSAPERAAQLTAAAGTGGYGRAGIDGGAGELPDSYAPTPAWQARQEGGSRRTTTGTSGGASGARRGRDEGSSRGVSGAEAAFFGSMEMQ